MIMLDNISQIKRKDPKNVLGSIELLKDQCQQAWNEVNQLDLPENYKKIKNIVFSGMGGSALGAYVIKDLFFEELPLSYEIVNDYNLPSYTNSSTLVILASYSGTTEETLSCLKQAIQKKAKLFILTTGGKLAQMATQYNLASYIFKPLNNPSNQPRLGTGYSIISQMALLKKINLLKITYSDIKETFRILEKGNCLYGIKKTFSENLAKKMAQNFQGKVPIIVVAEHLIGVGRVIRNQIHETAKNFADYYPLPELNHHLMEGLGFPKNNFENLSFLFLISKSYSERMNKRLKITQDVVRKNKIKVYNFYPTAESKIAQVFECIQFGAYMNYYLGILNGVDPSKIPWVDYFKKELAK